MEGSSESCWRKSDSFRGSDRNLQLCWPSRIGFSSNAYHDSCYMRIKGRERVVLAQRDLRRDKVGLPGFHENEVADPVVCATEGSDVSLRQWLDNPERAVDASECLHIFRQIVEIVNVAHSQGGVVHNVRPSCFVISSSNHVSFIEPASWSDSDSDPIKDGSSNQKVKLKGSSSSLPLKLHRKGSHLDTTNIQLEVNQTNASLQMTELGCNIKQAQAQAQVEKHCIPTKQILLIETTWYTSPEEFAGTPCCCASDIYRLGVILFELLCTFSSAEEKSSVMYNLRHCVLPPQLRLKWPNEASFCLWLLHPDPSGRPKMSELLQSEFLNLQREDIGDHKAPIELQEKIDEQELLLGFLYRMQKRRKEAADNLIDTISFLSSDLEEVTKQRSIVCRKMRFCSQLDQDSASGLPQMEDVGNENSSHSCSRKRYRPGLLNCDIEESEDCLPKCQLSETSAGSEESILSKNPRLMKNFKKLESAYLMTRHRPVKPTDKSLTPRASLSSVYKGSTAVVESFSVNNMPLKERYNRSRRSSWVINTFLERLCKYLSFSALKVKADLKQGDLLNSSNLVCSLSFDRDGEFFATAGVNKKIKVFEYDMIVNGDCDIHYPVVELLSRSKLSSICWSAYTKSQIASSNFDGIVQVWDTTRSQGLLELKEHEKRVWSVDYSLADPTMLVSGSDDGSVKLWNTKQGVSVGTIKTKANVCCVQFSPDSGHSLAFGSADRRIYYYDLRNSRIPLCVMIGHSKTVIGSPLQSFTGHTNVKNFVGLSVSDGYIATGSETNEVFIYHKAWSMPVLSYPLSGNKIDDSAQFISSVCWRNQSSTLVAANSIGHIKVLEMV
ncbi:hypothetical protein NMG60_11037067 [Bertholletia excelsa]